MQPKFPGMNPYLENPELGSEVHFGIIGVLARSLNAVITPKYRAAVKQRVYTDSLLVGIPDVSVVQRGTETPKPPGITATLSEPLVVTVPMVEETQERFLENVQTVLEQVYQEAALGLAIDYSIQPTPPLAETDFQWVQSLQEV